MYLEVSGFILLTIISMLMLLASVLLLILLSICDVIILITGIFAGALKLIWYMLMVQCI